MYKRLSTQALSGCCFLVVAGCAVSPDVARLETGADLPFINEFAIPEPEFVVFEGGDLSTGGLIGDEIVLAGEDSSDGPYIVTPEGEFIPE